MQLGTAKPLGRKHQPKRIWNSREQFYTELGLLLLGAAGNYSFGYIGMLPGNEIILLPVLPVLLLMHGRRAYRREYLWFYLLVLGWLFGTILADLYVGSSIANSVKGAARVIFFGLDFMLLAVLINNSTRRGIIFLLGIFFQMAHNMQTFTGDFLTQWKFGGSSIVTITALLLSCYFYGKRRYWAYVSVVFGVAALNLIFAFRSQIATVVVSAAVILPLFASGAKDSSYKNFFKTLVLLGLAGGAAFGANRAIQIAAEKGLFDESLSQKFVGQSGGKLGVLVGGRPETLVAIQAIRDSPILGHGSFAVEPKYLKLKQDLQYEYGYTDNDTPEDIESPVIPTHSHLTMAWVESGILGGVLWIYVLGLTVQAIMKVSFTRPALAPIYSYLLLNFVWNVLYSPFGSVNRMWAAFFILLSYKIVNSSTPQASSVEAKLPSRRTVVRLSRRPHLAT